MINAMKLNSATAKCALCHSHFSHSKMCIVPQPLQPPQMCIVPQPLQPPQNARCTTATSATAKCASCHSHFSHNTSSHARMSVMLFPCLSHCLFPSPIPHFCFFLIIFMPPCKPRKKPTTQVPPDNEDPPLSHGKRAVLTQKRNQEEREALHASKSHLMVLYP
jgi:hypothetical protein